MGSVQTLHDFTLNLLNDTASRVAFANDPQQVLADAGLGDINAADVHEVIPLVLDFVPVETATGITGDVAGTADNVTNFGGIANVVNGTDGECADGVQGAIDQLTALTAGLPVDVPNVTGVAGNLPVDVSGVTGLAGGLPVDVPNVAGIAGGLPVDVPNVAGIAGGLPVDVPSVAGVAGGLPVDVEGLVPAVSDVTDVANSAAGVTALAQNTVGSFALTDDLSRGLDSDAARVDANAVDGAVGTATGLVQDVPAVDAVAPAVDGAAVPAVGDLTSNIPAVDGVGSSALSTVGDLTSGLGLGGLTGAGGGIGHLDVADVTTKVHEVANNVGSGNGDIATNAAHEVASVANHAGVSDVHDVVSEVGNNIGHTIGNVGDINVGTGDIASGNDIHLLGH